MLRKSSTEHCTFVGKKYLILTKIECKDALTKNDSNAKVNEEKTKKIFVGGLPHDITQGKSYLKQNKLKIILENMGP